MGKLENIRNNFVKKRGGRLISVESSILVIALSFVFTTVMNIPIHFSFIIAFMIGFAFPVLIGTFKFLAWLAAVFFSLVWALLGFVIAGAVAGGSVLIGLFAGIIVFVISFIIHKHYSSISFQGINRKANKIQKTMADGHAVKEKVSFCPKCGRWIRTLDGKCDVCDK